MFDNIIAKIEELLNRFGEGIVEILRGEKDIAMYSMELKEKMDEIGKEMIKEACGLVDEIVRNEKKRKARYEVEGFEWIVGAEFVLDRFHLMREVIKISGGDKNIFAGIV